MRFAILLFLLGCATAAGAENLQGPIRIPASPYYYGVLAHPWTIGEKTRRIGNVNVPDAAQNAYVERLLDSWKSMGVRYVRMDYPGYIVEDRFGRINFASEDAIADRLLSRGIIELPVCLQYGAARWNNPGQKLWSSPEDYAHFCAAIATHIASHYPQFTRIELMNEPDQAYWWEAPPGSPYAAQDGSAAAQYLKAAYAAVKSADPALTIVAPAVGDGGRHHFNAFRFFENLYANGCRLHVCWDVISVHNYAWQDPSMPQPADKENQWLNYKAIQRIAVQHGDPVPHVMLTEVGFCHGEGDRLCQDPVTQARYMDEALNMALRDSTVDGITWQNGAHPEGSGEFSSINCEDDHLQPYPCYFVFRRFSDGPANIPVSLPQGG
jgi:hypothetical protein